MPDTGDRDAIDRIYRQGAFYKQGRDKWEREDSRQATIEKSLEGTTSRRSSYQSSSAIDYRIDVDPDQPLELTSSLSVRHNLPKTDEHLANVFCHLHGENVLWCEKWKKWLVWDREKWEIDNKLDVNLKA